MGQFGCVCVCIQWHGVLLTEILINTSSCEKNYNSILWAISPNWGTEPIMKQRIELCQNKLTYGRTCIFLTPPGAWCRELQLLWVLVQKLQHLWVLVQKLQHICLLRTFSFLRHLSQRCHLLLCATDRRMGSRHLITNTPTKSRINDVYGPCFKNNCPEITGWLGVKRQVVSKTVVTGPGSKQFKYKMHLGWKR